MLRPYIIRLPAYGVAFGGSAVADNVIWFCQLVRRLFGGSYSNILLILTAISNETYFLYGSGYDPITKFQA